MEMPSFFISRVRTRTASFCSRGSSSGIISTTVILVPKAAKAQASSRPMTPPPMTTMLAGSSVSASAPVESMQYS